jgi:hypothetical protein
MYLDPSRKFYGAAPRRRFVSHATRTMAAVRKLLLWRHNGPCDTDDGVFYIEAVLPLLMRMQNERGLKPSWARSTTCELLPLLSDAPEDWWEYQEDLAAKRRTMSVDLLARILYIREIELDLCFGPKRKRCGLVSVCRPKKLRAKEREAKKAARKRLKRFPGGLIYVASDRRIQPWRDEGISRRTWYRREKAYRQAQDGTTVTPNISTIQVGGKNGATDDCISCVAEPEAKYVRMGDGCF